MDTNRGLIELYCGDGYGKTSAAYGRALRVAADGGEVVIMRFLKQYDPHRSEFMSRLEPEIKVFQFEKNLEHFEQLSEGDKAESAGDMRNGLAYARKVLMTGDCDLMVLDEVMGLVEYGIISEAELANLLRCKQPETGIILTGKSRSHEVDGMIDVVYSISKEKNM